MLDEKIVRSSSFAKHSRERTSGALRAGDARVQWVKCPVGTKQGVLFYSHGGPRRERGGGPPTSQRKGGSSLSSAAEISDLSDSIRPPTGYLLFVIYMVRYASLSR